MAWTNITNAQLAIGAPVRSIDLLALRDNITALANGDSGAPRITDSSIGNVVAGTNYIPSIGQGSTSSLSLVKILEFRVMRSGSLTLRFTVSSSNVSGFYRIYKNGVALTSEGSVGAGISTLTLTGLSFSTNDLLQIYARTTDTDLGNVIVNNVRIGVASNTTLFPLSNQL